MEVSGRVNGFRWDRIAVLRVTVGSFSPLFVILLLLLGVHKVRNVVLRGAPIKHLLRRLTGLRALTQAEQLLRYILYVHIHVYVDIHVDIDIGVFWRFNSLSLVLLFQLVI